MDNYATYLLFSILATSAHFVWVSHIMKRSTRLHSLQVLAVSHVFSAVMLYPFLKAPAMSVFGEDVLWQSVILVGLLMWLARMLYYYAYSKTYVGDVAIFSSLTPVYGLVFAIAAGYAIAPQGVVGILLICASLYAYFSVSKHPAAAHQFLAPFKTVLHNKPLRLAFLSTFPPALAVVYHKRAVEAGDPILISFWICIIIGLCTLLTSFAMLGKDSIRISRKGYGDLLIAGILQTCMTVSLSFFLQYEHPAAAQALLRLAVLLQIIMAYVFLKERFAFRQHMFSAIIALFGTYLIVTNSEY